MYYLVHTHTKSKIAYVLSYAMHTFKFLHNIKYVLNQERDIIIHVISKKK